MIPFYIFSVESKACDEKANVLATADVIRDLERRGIPFRLVYGKYSGRYETSFLVSADCALDVVRYVKEYRQECALFVDHEGGAYFLPSQKIHDRQEFSVNSPAGWWTEVSDAGERDCSVINGRTFVLNNRPREYGA